MKLSVAQIKPVTGDIERNIVRHLEFVELAISHNIDLIVFPELSLTGYEPTLAQSLCIDFRDHRLDEFQALSDRGSIVIGVGVPTRVDTGITISLIFFLPQQSRQVYSKHYLHKDEEPFFVPGKNFDAISIGGDKVSFAICYEISIPEHTKVIRQTKAKFHIASVAKSLGGIDAAFTQLSETAKQFGIPVLMSNAIGPSDGGICAGRSSIWNSDGTVCCQFDDQQEGILVFDVSKKLYEQHIR
jgi:predicted amidohydrolase